MIIHAKTPMFSMVIIYIVSLNKSMKNNSDWNLISIRRLLMRPLQRMTGRPRRRRLLRVGLARRRTGRIAFAVLRHHALARNAPALGSRCRRIAGKRMMPFRFVGRQCRFGGVRSAGASTSADKGQDGAEYLLGHRPERLPQGQPAAGNRGG
jgi:hypothetical protein